MVLGRIWRATRPDAKPVAIEMKAAKGRLSPEQRDLHEVMRREGWIVICAFGFEDAVSQLTDLGI